MLQLNTAAELASSALVFLLIWLWTTRMHNARHPIGAPRPMLRGVLAGIFGAMCFWFNPAIIFDSHCFPQWDVWLIPFFLAAVLLASLKCWFAAGVSVAIAAFLKGQILLVAPIFILWPIFCLHWRAVVAFVAGALG